VNVQFHACIGGTSIGEPCKFEHGQHIVSGTPRRVFDVIRRRSLRTPNSRASQDQIYDVYHYLLPATQVVLLSATLPYDVLEMTTEFMTKPIRILVKRDKLML
ncbi:hypothetical protein DFH07DRAFT_1006816, partial [Mycena maculata]